jgi:hypothetical protein
MHSSTSMPPLLLSRAAIKIAAACTHAAFMVRFSSSVIKQISHYSKGRSGWVGPLPDGAAARAGVSEPGLAVLRRALGYRDREAGGAAHPAAGAASDFEPFSSHLS